jgi:hypothetical protein
MDICCEGGKGQTYRAIVLKKKKIYTINISKKNLLAGIPQISASNEECVQFHSHMLIVGLYIQFKIFCINNSSSLQGLD